MIPIPMGQQELLKQDQGSFSLYFQRMTPWNAYGGGVDKDEGAMEHFSVAANPRLKRAGKELETVHARQRRYLADRRMLGMRVFEFRAKLISPFVSGLGSGHPTETGMILDRNTGFPYLPASSVKGVLRLCHALNLLDQGMGVRTGESVSIPDDESSLVKYFGSIDTGTNSARGQLVFLDAYPEPGATMKLDIMNPHFVKYYTGKSTLPLENDSPIPLKFLALKEGATFVFRCVVSPLQQSEKPDGFDRTWSETDDAAIVDMFRRALDATGGRVTPGMGAKTAAGYGRFSEFKDSSVEIESEIVARKKAIQEKLAQVQKQEEQSRLSELSPDEREKLKYISADGFGELFQKSMANVDLTKEFYVWLKEQLIAWKQWEMVGNEKKNKMIVRCQQIQKKIDA